MSDIVEMLRTPTGCVDPSKWELQAADEIEKLRRRVEALELIIAEDLHPDDCGDDLNRSSWSKSTRVTTLKSIPNRS